jgi:hypothetical protein
MYLVGTLNPAITFSITNNNFYCMAVDLWNTFPTVYNNAIAKIDAVS